MYNYRVISIDEIADIKHLWEKNKDFHEETSAYFSMDYNNLNFENRMNNIVSQAEKTSIVVVESEKKEIVAYCFATISPENNGEIATLFVEEGFRKSGIGKNLLERQLIWFKENNIKNIFVEVLFDNISAIKLYNSIGFKQDTTRMRVPSL